MNSRDTKDTILGIAYLLYCSYLIYGTYDLVFKHDQCGAWFFLTVFLMIIPYAITIPKDDESN